MKKYIFALALVLPLFAQERLIHVYKSPSCGCCGLWESYMEKNGYKINSYAKEDFMKIKESLGIKSQYQSCHTGVIDGYAIEGHVPSSAVVWLLENKPSGVIGISAPGMPMGSPGMEQGAPEKYPVILMKKDGSSELFGYYIGDKKI
ncbi:MULTISPECIES: DUF411 domain-containing protein [Campylobacter]|uniref:DUF411 domain-containing protein n=1 Tax=Campylobacter TaxID=194 RepID=UPI000A34FD77|nr:DUF411 domain-containing protein [Campylobacter sp. P0024]MCR8679122.1 DUF411 domain-containing protein [Campylobacter sp. RM19072]